MYVSPLFKYSLKYARLLNPDRIYILSAEYGLISLEQEIEPYEKTLNTFSKQEIKEWEEKLQTLGDDSQLANIDLQNVLQKQQQTIQTLSNVSKMLHDTATSIIRKIG